MKRCLAHHPRRMLIASLCALGILTFGSLGAMIAVAEESPTADGSSTDAESQAELREALELKVRLNYDNVLLAESLENIEQLCDVKFDYTEKARAVVKSDPRVTFQLSQPTSLDKALRGMLTLHQLAYVIEGDRLLIVQAVPNKPINATTDRNWVARAIEHDRASIHLLVPVASSPESIPLKITLHNLDKRHSIQIGQTAVSIDCKIALTSDKGEDIHYTRHGTHFFNNRAGHSHYSLPTIKNREALHWQVELAEAFESLAPGTYWLSFEADSYLWDEEKRDFAQPLKFRTDRLKVVIEE